MEDFMFHRSELLKKRVHALTADYFIILVSNYFLVASFTNFIKTIFFHFPLHTQLFLINKLAIMSSVSLMLITFSYFTLFYFVTNGKTMGKSIFGLKVVNTDQSEMTLKQSMLRALAYFTCAMTGSFLFALSFIRSDFKSLGDIFSGTQVQFDQSQNVLSYGAGTEFQLSLVDSIDNSEINKAA